MEDPFLRVRKSRNRVPFGCGVMYGPMTKPECRHGLLCVIHKVKKEGSNQGREFFCCPNNKESSFKYFEWVPEEPRRDVGV